MQEFKIGQKQKNLIKVILNTFDDYILIDLADASLIDRYIGVVKWFEERGEAYSRDVKDLEKQYEGRELVTITDDEDIALDTDQMLSYARLMIDACKDCCIKIDSLFGAGTVDKYFRSSRELCKDFVPNEDCIVDFFEEITPVMEEVFNIREKRMGKYSRDRRGSSAAKETSK